MDTAPPGRRAVILSGGVAHDFESSSPALSRVLKEVGIGSTIETDIEEAILEVAANSADDGNPPLIVMNLLRWTMEVEKYAHLREQWSLSLTPESRAALVSHLERGGGILAMHGASICFDDWPEWADLLGAVWDWGSSFHPPLSEEPIAVTVTEPEHPIIVGSNDFLVVDEVYGFLRTKPDVVGLMSSAHSGQEHPLLWAREVRGGRVVYDALGHDSRSYEVTEHRAIVQRAALWAIGVPPTELQRG